jgi:hypothetical protein
MAFPCSPYINNWPHPDKAYANSKAPDGPPIRHANIRGRGYYH